jgi:hypothetical protein
VTSTTRKSGAPESASTVENVASPGIDKFASRLIRRKAREVVRCAGFNLSDRQDIEQELTLVLLRRLGRFNHRVAHYNAFVTTVVEPLAASYLGDAVVSGVTVSQITVNHASHDRADVDPSGGASLVSAYYGSAEILYVESGTGSKWAVLRLGSFVAPLLKAKAGAEIAVGNSGSVTIYRNGSATESVTAHLNWMDGNQAVAANSELLIQYFRDEAKWIIVGAECTT